MPSCITHEWPDLSVGWIIPSMDNRLHCLESIIDISMCRWSSCQLKYTCVNLKGKHLDHNVPRMKLAFRHKLNICTWLDYKIHFICIYLRKTCPLTWRIVAEILGAGISPVVLMLLADILSRSQTVNSHYFILLLILLVSIWKRSFLVERWIPP